MKKILYIQLLQIVFFKNDELVLRDKFNVVPFYVNEKGTDFIFIKRVGAMIRFILKNSRGASVMMTWFGDYHSAIITFFGRLLGKQVIIFAGGQEAICYPELQKGVYFKKFRGACVKFALKHATHIVVNHKSLIYHENYYYTDYGKKDGITYYIPGIKTPFTVIPNGIDTGKYYRDKNIAKVEDMVLTLGSMSRESDFLNKGFDLFVEVARRNPSVKFTLIGIKQKFMPWIEENYRLSGIKNLELILFFCPDEVLFQKYNQAKVFVQASITEGMPNTLSEAMNCECIPVGSNVNGIPDAMGDNGVIVMKRSVDELEQAILKALKMETGERAREYVERNFTLALRQEKLIGLLDKLLA